ncbi:MAG: hypothetical protein QOH88_2728 [Verrucomicrobiota bacterium]|jgi:hypothetical protein
MIMLMILWWRKEAGPIRIRIKIKSRRRKSGYSFRNKRAPSTDIP